MNFSPAAICLADTLDDRVADAAIQALQVALTQGLCEPDIDIIRAAAVKHRARLSAVAATLGHLRCGCCHQWISAAYEPDKDDGTGCAHVGEVDTAAVYHGLAVYMAAGGEVTASHTIPKAVAQRMKQTTGGT